MKNLYCSFLGHEFIVTKHVTNYVKEFNCKHCGKKFTTDQSGNLTRLTPKHQEINRILERIHLKKQKRKILNAHSH